MTAELGLVYASRDDDYAGGVNDRLVRSIKVIQRLARKLDISVDMVVVDWNSPPGRGLVNFCAKENLSGVRIIRVSEDLARAMGASQARPFLEYPAKNVGLHYVDAEQVLVLNPDIVMSRDLLRSCVARPHLHDSFLRADRTDFRWLGRYRKVALRRHVRHGETQLEPITLAPRPITHRMGSTAPLKREKEQDGFIIGLPGGVRGHFLLGMHTNAAGDFICTSRRNWLRAGGFAQDRWLTGMGDAVMVARLTALNLRQVIKPGAGLWHEDHVSDPSRGGTWSETLWPHFLQELVSAASTPPTPMNRQIFDHAEQLECRLD